MQDSGDCTVITTPSKKNVVIDTGEQEKVITKYLLDRKIKNIDYLMISHFDSDHCKKATEIMEKLNVENIVISRQVENCQELEEVVKVAHKEKVNILLIKAGDIINVDKDVYIKILWPGSSTYVKENPCNNNSIVAKICYKNFNILFTGDIEQIAEEEILKTHSREELQSTIIKIAHHGSKTSSTMDFLKTVQPKLALIGVGENNKFGHPSTEVLKRLEEINCNVYRTDESGEIIIKSNGKNFKVYRFIQGNQQNK